MAGFMNQPYSTGPLELGNHSIESITLEAGDALVIVGPSGSGKTLAAYQMAGLRQTNSGASQPHTSGADKKRLSTSLLPSNPSLLFSCLTRSVHREIEIGYQFLGLLPPEKEIQELLESFDLIRLADQCPFSLSGGEQVRLGLALALVKRPDVLITDCAFEHLDPESDEALFEIIERERRERGLISIAFHSRIPRLKHNNKVRWLFSGKADLFYGSLAECWRNLSEDAPELLDPPLRLAAKLVSTFDTNYLAPPCTAREIAGPFASSRGPSLPPLVPNEEEVRPKVRLRAENLTFCYRKEHPFRLGPISLKFQEGRTTALLGKNGSGKTTLLRCLANLNSPWSGRIWAGHKEIRTTEPAFVSAKDIIYCFQRPDDQIYLPTVLREITETARQLWGRKFLPKEAASRIISILDLEPYLSKSPFDLPLSVRRLVSIAGAFVASPGVILLDEPTVGLDTQQIENIIRLIRDYNDHGGTSVLVSHDFDFVSEIADNVVIMAEGKTSDIKSKGDQATWPYGVIPIVPAVAQELGITRVWRESELLQAVSNARITQGHDGKR